MQVFRLFVTGYKGFETALFHEVRGLLSGTEAVIDKRYGGIEVEAGLDAVYCLCLHSRLANRVFCELAQARVEDEAQLYQACMAIDWSEQMDVGSSLAVSATLSRSKLTHGHFAALRVKDAIVDQFRERSGERPRVSKKQPDIQVHVNIHRNQASISLDLSGDSLHRRGYRLEHGGAPLREHLAAALLVQAGWSGDDAGPRRLVDPMCGSGTLVIEAAMMAAAIAPGLRREYFGFLGWRPHREETWQQHLARAREAVIDAPAVEIHAGDYDAEVLRIARDNAARAGVAEMIRFSHQRVDALKLGEIEGETLVICNPPYGQRLQSEGGLGELYDELGAALRTLAPARLAVISANPDQLHRLRLARVSRKNVRNGPLDCVFAIYASDTTARQAETAATAPVDDPLAQPLRNRLQKNARHLQRWARRNDIGCYRLYDADLPEFAFSLDCYQGEVAAGQTWYLLQEYQAPASIDPGLAAERIALAQRVVGEVFEIAPGHLFSKTRSRQRGANQYQKQDNRGEYFQVREGAASLLVNLSDYLDPGLFLDHRVTRDRVYREARGKRVLNLFCYTATVGVLAALGGADLVVNVDMSASYLKWAGENHRLNGLDDEARYRLLRADIVDLLQHPGRHGLEPDFDLVFLDPPSFSNSSKMQQTLDIQRDHATLIRQAMALLKSDGLLLFSTNRRRFRLAPEIGAAFAVRDITQATISEDFKRNPKIHQCWEIRHGTVA